MDGDFKAQFSYVYDYVNNNGTYERKNIDENVIDSQVFQIKGMTSDCVSLVHVLSNYIGNIEDGEIRKIYLLPTDPELYKINVTKIKKERNKTPAGEFNTIKVQLKADLGFISIVLSAFVPPTYVWYVKEYPHQWIQYEGMDGGMKSANIRATLTGVR
ncbi:MAG: hypothetical protein ACI9E5_001048 [Candidatus Omnitrophota bacterium]|jgi:hypothetical protein